jgi:phage host-nuclease inhibitor protein Gam
VTEKKPDNKPTSQVEDTDNTEDIIDVEVIETSDPDTDAPHVQESTGSQSNSETRPTTNPPEKRPTPWGWITAFILAAFIGGLFSADYAKSQLETLGLIEKTVQPTIGANNNTVQELISRLSDIDKNTQRLETFSAEQETIIKQLLAKQEALEKTLTSPSSDTNQAIPTYDPSELDAVRNDIEKLSQDLLRLATIKSDDTPEVSRIESAVAVTNAEVNNLQQKLSELETALNTVASGAIHASPQGRLVLLLTQMKEKAASGLSFASDIQALRVDLVNLPALDQQAIGAELAKLEATGGIITPYDTLLRSFDETARNIMHAQEKNEGSFLTSLFTVRKRGAGAEGLEGQLYNAEKRLIARDIEGAVSILAAIDSPVRDAGDIWIKNAEQNINTLKALDAILFRISGKPMATAGVNQ